jgi:amidase
MRVAFRSWRRLQGLRYGREMSSPDQLSSLDATAQAALVRSGDVSPVELVDAAIIRAQTINPALNGIIFERYEQARADAASPHLPDGPFRGVPFAVKDLSLMQKGEPYNGGTRFLKQMEFRAPIDTYLFTKFRTAGFVTIGRTNTPEFGTTITTEPLAHGPSRNPWNTDHSTGGSSGGSAAVTAAGIVPVAHANDGGGSIRIPASECGLVGLKPTRARVSQGPTVGEAWMGSVIDHVVARSVRDSAAILDCIHGPMPGDPYAAPTPARPFATEVGTDPGQLRIGFFAGPTLDGFGVHDECVAAVTKAAKLLVDLGHHVEQTHPGALTEQAFGDQFVTIIAACTAADVNYWQGVVGRQLGVDDLEPENLFFAEVGRGVSAPDYLSAVAWMHGYQRRMASWWAPSSEDGAGFDVLVTPTIAQPPPPIGWMGDPSDVPGRRVRMLLQYTAQFNVTGQPAISLPLHWTSDGLPVGVQLVSGFGREDVLIRLASQIEAAQPWSDRRPPLHA